MRCFLAVPLSQPGLGDAQRLLARLRERVVQVRWARPETLHVTVHFFGETPQDEVARALEAVVPVLAHTAHFSLTLSRLGSFPGRGWPRVLWLGCKPESAEAAEFARHCCDALAATGFEVERRPFRAHCTLGRPRVPWSSEGRAAWEAAVSDDLPPCTFTADRLVLYESHPGPGGSVYLERASLPLAAGAGTV